MVDETLIASLGISDDDATALLTQAFGDKAKGGDLDFLLGGEMAQLTPGSIIEGRIVGLAGDDVVVELGLKSEGLIPKIEFDSMDDIVIGDKVKVQLVRVDGDGGGIEISKRRADRQIAWQRIIDTTREGDLVEGKVVRKIKGGLLVDIGVLVFLPASQVDVRRPGEIGDYIGRDIRAQVLKIDTERNNIVISRRKLIEDERESAKKRLLTGLQEGQLVKGEVKSITDYGVRGSWRYRRSPPHHRHVVEPDRTPSGCQGRRQDRGQDPQHRQRQREDALGLKQREPSPWIEIEQKYPVGSRVKGTIVNIVSYGAFVRLEEGIEGLVHISEMSWTRRVNHPSEVVNVNDEVDVVVLDIDINKQEISLGMKQTEVNPWELVSEKYPVGTVVEGTVRNLANYGAFIEIEPGIDGLLHVSDISWTKKVTHPNEVFKKGDTVRCVILDVDREKQRIALGLKQLTEDPWVRAIPDAYRPGMVVRGTVTKITNFGVFVELEDDLEGLLHISELADHKVENPQDVVAANQEIDVKILRVDIDDRKIGLSLSAPVGRHRHGSARRACATAARGLAPTRGGMDTHGAHGNRQDRLPGYDNQNADARKPRTPKKTTDALIPVVQRRGRA